MTTPTFSTISDLYSPTQLQRALVEAERIAGAFMHSRITGGPIPTELLEAYERLGMVAKDAAAEYDACMRRTAPKVSDG